MKNLATLWILVLLCGCAAPTEASFFVAGSCDACGALIEEAVEAVPGAEYLSWTLESSSVTIYFDGTEQHLEQIQQAISEAGFDTQYFPANPEAQQTLPTCCHKSLPAFSSPEGHSTSPH